MDKNYKPKEFEQSIYNKWLKNKAFAPNDSDKTFCIIMPPPNANDPLHIGHALFVSIEDIFIRYHRMLQEASLWLPGTDHAGIETQFVFEKKLKKQGKSRFDFDRETLYKKIEQYVKENSDISVNQLKQLGASADWDRFKFTLDKDIVDFVLDTFFKLFEKGLIYRDNKLVNYCTKCGTGFSNLEVKHEERKSKLYYIKYGPITIATTRPETKFADIAIAVHPDDKRYQKYIGKTIKIQCLEGEKELIVLADEFVDKNFGTGAVKITPYHDFNDFLFYKRHKHEIKQKPQLAINHDGRLTSICGKYKGLKTENAREKIVKDLEEKGLLVKVEKHRNNVSVCYRCQNPIEPLPIPQFYIKVKPLTKKAKQFIKEGKIEVIGSGHDKILNHWLDILEDWNISRQIVWGIRMPVWYKIDEKSDIKVSFIDKNNQKHQGDLKQLLKEFDIKTIKQGLQSLTASIDTEYILSKEDPGDQYIQETDTFDTWFSSSQWPVATLKTGKPGDFKRFYPTSIMETAYDILMFWVMRMIMLGIFLTGKEPFKKVYLHGLIRDQHGRKISKSKGNVINPLDITEKYGTDTLRFALVVRSSPGLDKSIGERDFKAARNFINKLWNASRYIIENKNVKITKNTKIKNKNFKEKLSSIIRTTSESLQQLRPGFSLDNLQNEFWHWFCDIQIEKNKKNELSDTDLLIGLVVFLKLLHPFIPFVTETIWQKLIEKDMIEINNKNKDLLIISTWPDETKL